MTKERGVVYVTAGEEFRQEAVLSAQTVRKHNPELDITLVTDKEPNEGPFSEIRQMETPTYGFSDKPLNMQLPYERTVFLDTDIYVNSSIDPLFEVLNQFDIAAAHNNRNYRRGTCQSLPTPRTFPELNSGVISFRRNRQTKGLLSDWKERVENGSLEPGDQPSFTVSVWESDARFTVLPPEFNCKFRHPNHIVGDVVCFHGRLHNVGGQGAALQYDVQKAVNEYNSSTSSRVVVPTTWGTFRTYDARSLPHQVRNRFREGGISGLLKRAVERLRNWW